MRRPNSFSFNPILSVEQSDYIRSFSNKIIYYIIEIVQVNPGITVNQVCSLLRNTLRIPEELSRNTLGIICGSEFGLFKTYMSERCIKHLFPQNNNDAEEVKIKLRGTYPELMRYFAPKYRRKNTSKVALLKGG